MRFFARRRPCPASTALRWPRCRPQLSASPFYESDCQGRSSASLIAERPCPEQSAPIAEWVRLAGAAGVWEQSSSASFTSLETPDPTWTNASAGVARTRTTVLSETRPGAGLTLLRVLRGGLALDECLGVTAGRANGPLETAPRTLVPDPGAVGEGNVPAPWPRGSRR